MDELVRQAMARWPDVPAAWGWLRLDARGHWYLVDRNAPDFDPLAPAPGTRVAHEGLIGFIARNYLGDGSGRWHFQNGPQQVFVDVDVAPLVLRVLPVAAATPAGLVTHTGLAVTTVTKALVDPHGHVLLATDLGPGVVHDLDLGELLEDDQPDESRPQLRVAGARLVAQPCTDPQESLGFVARPRDQDSPGVVARPRG